MTERMDDRSKPESAGDELAEPFEVQLESDLGKLYPAKRAERGFRRRLGDDLLATMECRAKLRVVAPPERRRWALIAGATVGSLVPLVGLAAYLVRSRLAGGPQQATSL